MKVGIVIILSCFYLFQQDEVNKVLANQFHTYDTRNELYKYNQDFEVPYIQVENMKNKKLEDKVNKLLRANSYEWMEKYPEEEDSKNLLLYYNPEEPEITLQTARYLSIKYKYNQVKFIHKLWKPEYNNCITINMKTGERVKLKELLDINRNLVERIKEKKH